MLLNIKEIKGVEDYVIKRHDKLSKPPIHFICGDNMEFLRYCYENMLKGYFHVGIVDPPYGIGVGDMKLGATKDSKPRDYEMGSWDYEVPSLEYWFLLRYACRDLIIWGGNYFTATNVGIYRVELDNGDVSYRQDSISLFENNKLGKLNDGIKKVEYFPGVESGRCFYFWNKRTNGRSFADGELALTTFDSSARVIDKSRSLNNDDGDKRHPTQKPHYLYDFMYIDRKLAGKRILDTHGGSFSHAVSAFKNEAELFIMDIEKSYFKSGLASFDNYFIKPTFF